MNKEFFFKIEQKQTHASTVYRITRHQLGMWETLINVFIDDVGLIQNQVTLNQNGHLPVWVHDVDIFGLVIQVDIANLEVHALFEQNKAATVRKGAGCS